MYRLNKVFWGVKMWTYSSCHRSWNQRPRSRPKTERLRNKVRMFSTICLLTWSPQQIYQLGSSELSPTSWPFCHVWPSWLQPFSWPSWPCLFLLSVSVFQQRGQTWGLSLPRTPPVIWTCCSMLRWFIKKMYYKIQMNTYSGFTVFVLNDLQRECKNLSGSL